MISIVDHLIKMMNISSETDLMIKKFVCDCTDSLARVAGIKLLIDRLFVELNFAYFQYQFPRICLI